MPQSADFLPLIDDLRSNIRWFQSWMQTANKYTAADASRKLQLCRDSLDGIEALANQTDIDRAFYDLTVQQRNLAWEQLAKNTDRP